MNLFNHKSVIAWFWIALVFVTSAFGQVPNPAGPIPLVQTVPLTNAIYGRIGITNMMLLVRGDNVIGDGGGGVFAWLHGDTNTADNARYFAATNGGNWYKISYWDDGTGGGGGGGGLGTNAFVNGVLFQPIMFTNNLSSDVGRLMWYTNANGHVVGYATNVASATTPSYVAAASSGQITNAYFQATTDIFYNVSGTNIQAYLVTEAVEDLIGASLVAGSNITISYDDGGTGKTTISGISSGATNGTPVSVDSGGTLVAANFTDTTGINFGVSGTNVTANLTDRNWGDITTSSSGTSVAINANSVTLGTDTTGNYIATIAGTANEVDAAGSGSETAGVIVSLPSTIDLGGKTSFEVPNAAAPTVDAFGEVAGDNDAWAAGRGALLFYDGTAATRLVGVLASDTPSNGQVPKWNTGGTITWEDDSTGVGGSGTIVTVDGGADNTRVNLADTTGIGVTLSGTNASFALVDRDFGAVTVSGSGTSIALDDGTVTSNKVVAANITIDKLSASGTPLSTNFLAGDYAWKQVTTNMIPGLNAILATIGSGGGGGGLGTNLFVNNILSQPAKLTNSTTLLWSTNSNGDIIGTVTNVAGTTTDDVVQRTGFALFTIDSSYTMQNLSVGGVITNATVAAGNATTRGLIDFHVSPARSSTNYVVHWEIEGEDPTGLGSPNAAIVSNSKTTSALQLAARFDNNERFPNSVKYIIWLEETVSVGGTGGSGSDTNWNGNPIASGTITNLTTTRINGVVPAQQEKGALFWDFVTAPPFMTALALSSGASFPTTGTTNDPFALIAQTGGSSTNSGHGYYTGASSYNVAGGEEWEFGWYIHKTNNVGFRTGLLDVLSATASATDGIYIEQQTNGTYRGVSVANASLSATASSYVPVEDSTIQYKGTWAVASNPTNIVFTIYTNGVSVWTDTVSANIPTNTARLTGLGFFSWHGGSGSGTNLIKYGWFSFKPAFRGSR